MIHLIDITNLEAPGLAPFTHLNESQLKHYYEPYGGLFIGESPNVIIRALDAGYLPVSVLMERKYITTEGAEILRRIGEGDGMGDIPIYVSDINVLSRITGYHLTRGILCAFRRKTLPSMAVLCDGAKRVAVLENIENPTNVGAVFRSAAALNMDAVLLTPECADPLYRRAVRVSVGTVFQVPWTYIGLPERHYTWMKNGCTFRKTDDEGCAADHNTDADREAWPQRGMEQLKGLGFQTAAMALQDNAIPIDDKRLRLVSKLAVIFGNEGDGLLSETIKLCDYTVRIPMSHGVDSLNVAAASAVAFWELGKM